VSINRTEIEPERIYFGPKIDNVWNYRLTLGLRLRKKYIKIWIATASENCRRKGKYLYFPIYFSRDKASRVKNRNLFKITL
jgi:hypothetical protein